MVGSWVSRMWPLGRRFPGVHATAVVHPQAHIAPTAIVGPFCVIGPNVQLHHGVKLHSHVHVDGHTEVGKGSVVHSHSVLGALPQDLKYRGEDSHLKIGAECAIHSHAHICGGTAVGGGVTTIDDHALIMSFTHVGHDSQMGKRVILASRSSIAGHVVMEDDSIVSGDCNVHQKVTVGTGAFLGSSSTLYHDLVPYGMATGRHASLEGLNLRGLRRRGVRGVEQREMLRAIKYM